MLVRVVTYLLLAVVLRFICQKFWRQGGGGGRLHTTEEANLLFTHHPLVRFPKFPKNFRGKIIDVAEVNQCHWFRGTWHENVNSTHLVLASGNPVLQKKFGGKILFRMKPSMTNFSISGCSFEISTRRLHPVFGSEASFW